MHRDRRVAFVARDLVWEDKSGGSLPFSYAARKLDASIRTAPGLRDVETTVIEQCTWHAARRKRSPGERAFVGSYFAATGTRATPLADRSLADWDGADELFRSLLPRR